MDRTLRAPVVTPRRALLALLFFGSSVLVACGLAAGLRELLPYDSLRRFTAEERFMAWEGVLWMAGLAMVLLGGAGVLGTLHLLRMRIPGPGEVRDFARDLLPSPHRFSLAPWWMVSTGAVLIFLALHARAQLPG
jgi:hypothetical protein